MIQKLTVSLFTNTWLKMLFVSALALAMSFVIGLAPVSAQNRAKVCEGIGATVGTADGCSGGSGGVSVEGVVRTVINLLSYAVGVVSVIMIIIGGFKYIMAAGDSNQIQSAKNTILFAIVGLVIVAIAQVIVQFVINEVAPAGEELGDIGK